MKLKYLFLIILIFNGCFSFAQTKYALVIAISNYPQIPGREKNWAVLSSKNDYDLVMEMLKRQQFNQDNIISLLDQRATVENIEKAFDKLIADTKPGDIIYFHYSGHGQQIADVTPEKAPKSKYLKKDERDGFDEALVTYNAPLKFEKDYQYQDHFVDDQMNYYMNRLRKKIGGNGQVIAVFDCCHSGSATRGENTEVVRGSSIICAPPDYSPDNNFDKDSSMGFDADFDYSNSEVMGKLTAFFGCKSDQVDREVRDDKTNKGYGSLTYYFIKALEELGPNSSYNNLFSKINEKMVLGFRNEQQPEIEGDNLNQLIFKGAFIDQKSYYQITNIKYDEITINGGSLQSISVGDSIGVFPNTTISAKAQAALFTGVVSEIQPYSSTIKLTQSFDKRKDAEVLYRAFVTYSAAPPVRLKLNINVKSKGLRKELNAAFSKEKAIEFADADFDYQIADTNYNDKSDCVVVFLGTNKERVLRGMTPLYVKGDAMKTDSLLQFIKQSMKTDLFRKLNIEEESLSFEYKIIPCALDGTCISDSSKAANGNLRFTNKSKFKLTVKNTSEQRMFINIFDIDPNNVLAWGDPKSKKMRNVECTMGEQKSFIISISPPYGTEQMKIIATDRPVDFNALQENGTSLSRGGDNNPLLDYVDRSVNGTRGAGGTEATGATVKTLTFEIMPK
ncbi:MAG: caspase family protein [Bacteroidota bacterium]